MAEADALPLASLTAWQVLVQRARLRPGQRVLVMSARAASARSPSGSPGIWARRSRRRSGRLAKELGADVVIDHRREIFEQRLSGYADYSFLFIRADGRQLAGIPTKAAGEPITYIVLDDATDPMNAAQNARKLVSKDQVDVHIGSTATPGAITMTQVAAETKIPIVTASPVELTAET